MEGNIDLRELLCSGVRLGRPVPKKEERGKEAKVANLSQGGTLKNDGYLEEGGPASERRDLMLR